MIYKQVGSSGAFSRTGVIGPHVLAIRKSIGRWSILWRVHVRMRGRSMGRRRCPCGIGRSILVWWDGILRTAWMCCHTHRGRDLRHLKSWIARPHGHELMPPNVSHVSLLFLMLGIGKSNNERPRRTIHHKVVVQAFDCLKGRFTLDESEECSTFARTIGIANHVNLFDFPVRSKYFSYFLLSSFAG